MLRSSPDPFELDDDTCFAQKDSCRVAPVGWRGADSCAISIRQKVQPTGWRECSADLVQRAEIPCAEQLRQLEYQRDDLPGESNVQELVQRQGHDRTVGSDVRAGTLAACASTEEGSSGDTGSRCEECAEGDLSCKENYCL